MLSIDSIQAMVRSLIAGPFSIKIDCKKPKRFHKVLKTKMAAFEVEINGVCVYSFSPIVQC
jgi:hypothetical protein